MTGRRRVTISLASDLLRRIDEESRKRHEPRSRVMEEQLLSAERQKRQAALDKEIEEYYAQGDPEGEAISKWAGQAMSSLQLDDEPAPKRKRR
jgi:predicted transcriptional regulator